MVISLKEIGESLGYSNTDSVMDTQYLTYLAWSGSFEDDSLDEYENLDFNIEQHIHHIGLSELTYSSYTYQTYDSNGNITNNPCNATSKSN